MSTNVLPPRFREKSFRRYEDDLLRALKAYPNSILIAPKDYDLSAVTVAQRFRDAKKSLLDNKWETKIPRDLFERLQDDLIVRETMNGMVKVGPIKEVEVGHDTFIVGGKFETFSTPSSKPFDATHIPIAPLIWLAHNNLLKCPLIVKIDDSKVDELYNSYDINLDRQEDGFYILT